MVTVIILLIRRRRQAVPSLSRDHGIRFDGLSLSLNTASRTRHKGRRSGVESRVDAPSLCLSCGVTTPHVTTRPRTRERVPVTTIFSALFVAAS